DVSPYPRTWCLEGCHMLAMMSLISAPLRREAGPGAHSARGGAWQPKMVSTTECQSLRDSNVEESATGRHRPGRIANFPIGRSGLMCKPKTLSQQRPHNRLPGRTKASSGYHLQSGSLQLLASLKIGSTLSLPQIFLPARLGFRR